MTQLTDIEMAFRDALWEEIGSHADMTIGELNLAVHRTLTALEAKGLVIEQWWRPIETAPKDGTDIILAVPSQQFDGKPTDPRSTVGHWAQDEERKIYLGDCGGECRCPEYDYDEDATWISWDGGFTKENPPTHWRPLPEPPAMISSAEQGEG